MKRALSLFLSLLFVSVFVAYAQERHYSYRYVGTNYKAANGGRTTMTNKGSSCRLPSNFVLSILTDKKSIWLDSGSTELRFVGSGKYENGGYMYVSPAEFDDVMGSIFGAEPDIMKSLGVFVYNNASSIIVTYNETSATDSRYITKRLDHYTRVSSVSAPDNLTRAKYEREEADRKRSVAQLNAKLERERQQTERVNAAKSAKRDSRLEATIGKPFPMADFYNSRGEKVSSSYFSRGKKTLVITRMVGCHANTQLKKYLDNYPEIASQIVTIFWREGSGNISYDYTKPITPNKLYIPRAGYQPDSWVFGDGVPYIVLLDESGRVLDYMYGYDSKDRNDVKWINSIVDRLRHSNRTYGPYKVGDFYNDGKKYGVVFEVSTDGYSGKIVSLKQSAKRLHWTIDEYERKRVVWANSATDGWYNYNIIRSISAWNRLYPAFEWCRSLGADWYLPSIEELRAFTLNKSVADAVNKTLIAMNADKLYSDNGSLQDYWSSTEYVGDESYKHIFVESQSVTFSKAGNIFVRAVAKFGKQTNAKIHKTFAPYKIGDFYNDGDKKGVVFDIAADGRTAKIVNLYHNRVLKWTTDGAEAARLVGTNSADGAYNKSVINHIDNWQTKYPAHKWCQNLGDGWYIPSIDELKVIYQAGKSVYPILHNKEYWSSNETVDRGGNILAYTLSASDGKVNSHSKGYEYSLCAVAVVNICAPKQSLTSAPYKVGDYYNDGAKEGVVFDVAADGKSGKIVSMKQQSMYWAVYGDESYRFIGADNPNDGVANMKVVQSIDSWQTKYPAFKWCADFGEGWYLPSMGELSKLLFADNVRNAVNSTLVSKGAKGLANRGDDIRYWSSTEKNHKFKNGDYAANNANMKSYSTYYTSKWADYIVRAVAAFDDDVKSEQEKATTTLPLTSAPYKVGDLYNDGVKQGVVIEAWDGGKSGKIISLAQSYKAWSWDDEICKKSLNASNFTDGTKNMALASHSADWINDYPAFKWCADLGEGWYLPAVEELRLLALDKSVCESVNATLQANGAPELDKVYWTSTEGGKMVAKSYPAVYTISMGGKFYEQPKCNGNYLRALSLFGSTPRPKTTLARDKTTAPYKVGDYYNDGEKDGIVFLVSAGGHHGMIVGISEPMNSMYWSSYGFVYEGVKSKNDGAKNMVTIRRKTKDCSGYPIFNWCIEQGEGWFVPSIKELQIIYQARQAINNTLPINRLSGKYWSSTESNKVLDKTGKNKYYSAWYLDFDNGASVNDYKSKCISVRIVATF